MKVILYLLLIHVFLMKQTFSIRLILPNPLDVAGKIAEDVDKSAKTVVIGVAKDVKTTADIAQNGTNKIIGKVHNGVFDIEKGFVNGVEEVIGTPVNIKDVTFYLATSSNYENPTLLDYYKPENVANSKGKTYFLIHGWQSSKNASWYHDLAEIFTRTNPDSHVIQVNWDKPASDNYAFAAFNTESVGNIVGVFLNKLVTEYKVPKENIVLIGHSLGGQISGWAGKKFQEFTGEKLPRIVALDPAGPLFVLRPNSRRLNKDDAEVVHVVHTDGDKLGFPSKIGTIDFFPNGGNNQPGCWTVDLGKISTYVEPVTCDHSRAWDFFVEAVNTTGSFLSNKCRSFGQYEAEKCEDIVAAMGDLQTKLEGMFYLKTKSERPYSFFEKIKEGIKDIKDKIVDKIENIGSTTQRSIGNN